MTPRVRGLVLIGLVGCTPIYDAQHDDRATQLEAFRTEFLPGSASVQFMMGSESRFFWLDLVSALQVPTLHSIDPGANKQVDYTFPDPTMHIAANTYTVSDLLVVQCGVGSVTAWDATMADQKIDMITDENEPVCAADGNAVYLSENRTILKWVPGSGNPPSPVFNEDNQIGATAGTIDAFAVLGNTAVIEETARLWRADLSTSAKAIALGADTATGMVDFDAQGVLCDTEKGTEYISFADLSVLSLTAAIADGGYDLNFKYSDIQTQADGGGYSLQADHMIYRGNGGIFAYGFTSKKVVDLLLDRGTDIDTEPMYGDPIVTTDGTMFVQDITETGGAMAHPVYRVNLTGRLR